MKINLLDPTVWSCPPPMDQFRWLTRNDPVHWHDEPGGSGFWAVTGHPEIRALETDSDTYSNLPWTVLGDHPPPGDDDHRMLIFSDPPSHTQRRAFMGEELNPIPVRSQREHLEEIVTEVIDDVIERGECDLVVDVAGRLASFVIADMMGLSRAEAVELFPAAEIMTRGADPSSGVGLAANTILMNSAAHAWQDRRANPGDDWLSRLAHGDAVGHPMDQTQFVMDFLLIINAGSDTTRNAVSTGMQSLFEHRDQYRALVDDPSLVPQAVEEILRFTPPVNYQRRTATTDAVLGGKEIKKGQKLLAFYAGANRDPRVFEDPDSFNIRRATNPHLTFGAGRHFCLGSHLARLELTVMFGELVRRIPDMEPAGPAEWYELAEMPGSTGPAHIPVRFTPGARLGVADRLVGAR